jgi:hypothetical protein
MGNTGSTDPVARSRNVDTINGCTSTNFIQGYYCSFTKVTTDLTCPPATTIPPTT